MFALRMRATLIGVASTVLAIAGGTVGTLATPTAAAAEDCEFNLCSEGSGNCFPTDKARYNCDETADGCKHKECGQT
jgi:hypothetical protein